MPPLLYHRERNRFNSLGATLYRMELEEPTEAVCPLCEDEIVEIKLNNSEKEAPYFTCRTHQTTVPGMYGGPRSEDFVREHIDLAQKRDDGDDGEEEDSRTLGQILGGENDE